MDDDRPPVQLFPMTPSQFYARLRKERAYLNTQAEHPDDRYYKASKERLKDLVQRTSMHLGEPHDDQDLPPLRPTPDP